MLRFESYRRGIVWSSVANLAAQGLVFATSVAFAGLFGTQSSTDVYYYGLNIVTLISGFLTSIDNGVVLPEAMRLAEQAGQDAAMGFINFFLYAFLALGAALTALLLGWPLDIALGLSRFDAALLAQHLPIIQWVVPLAGLMVLSQFLLDVLSAYKFFTLPMIFNVLNRLLVLASMLALHEQAHVLSIVWATLAATVLQIVLCLTLMKRALGWRFRIVDRRLDRRIMHNIGFALTGNLTATLAAGIPVALLSGFSAGVLTAMNFAQRLASMPMSLMAGQISQVMGIRFNEQVARRDWTGVNRSFAQSVRVTCILLVPAALYLCIFAEDLVRIFFQRGRFDSYSTELVGTFFRLLVLALPFTGVNMLVGRVFMAGQRIREGFYYQVLANAVLIALIIAGLRVAGPTGYPLAQLAFYALNLLTVGLAFRLLFRQIAYGHALAGCLPLALGHVAAAGVAWLLRHAWQGAPPLLVLAAGFAVCAALPLWQLGRTCNTTTAAVTVETTS